MKTHFSESSEVQRWLDCYQNHLEKVRGLAPCTSRKYMFIACKFMEAISTNGVIESSMFTPDAIVDFVRCDVAPRTGQGAFVTTAALRSFLRFLVSEGALFPGVEVVVPRIRSRSRGALPQHLTEGEIKQVLADCADGTAKGKLNCAVVVLLSRLGLRAQEVAGLQLSDVDWANGSILIQSGKTRCERRLPLVPDVAKALLSYLKDGRPKTSVSFVFVQQYAHDRPVTSSAITKRVKRLLVRSGIGRTGFGAHLFRHTVATELVNRGVTFKDVADLLGHQSINSTAVYAKLNLVTLSQISLPWPGGAQ